VKVDLETRALEHNNLLRYASHESCICVHAISIFTVYETFELSRSTVKSYVFAWLILCMQVARLLRKRGKLESNADLAAFSTPIEALVETLGVHGS